MFRSLCLQCFVFLTRPGWLFSFFSLLLISCFLVWSVPFLWCYAPMSVTSRENRLSGHTSRCVLQHIFKEYTPIPPSPSPKTGCIWCYAIPAAEFAAQSPVNLICFPDSMAFWADAIMSMWLELGLLQSHVWLKRKGVPSFMKPKIRTCLTNKTLRTIKSQASWYTFIT